MGAMMACPWVSYVHMTSKAKVEISVRDLKHSILIPPCSDIYVLPAAIIRRECYLTEAA